MCYFTICYAKIADWLSRGEYAALVDKLHANPVDVVLPPAGTCNDIERAVADTAPDSPVLGSLDEGVVCSLSLSMCFIYRSCGLAIRPLDKDY